MGPLRIAQLAPPWLTVPPSGYGGIEAVVAHLADGLVERGHDVTLYAPGGSHSNAKVVSPFPFPAGTDKIGEAYPELIQALTCYMDSERFDVIHDHSGYIGPALGAFSPVPVVVTVHGAFVPEMRRLYWLVGRKLHVVAISDAQRDGMAELSYAATIPNGIDVESFPYTPDKEGYLAYVGRFSPDKGADVAIDTAHRVGMPLVLAGKAAEPHEQRFLEERIFPALQPTDDYRGEVSEEEKRKIFAGANALLFPIQWDEPFGLVMIEAMACGTPVVAMRHGAVPEVVADGRTGFVVSDPDEMEKAVLRLDEIDPRTCRTHVEEHFSAAAMVDAYVRVYRTVLGSR